MVFKENENFEKKGRKEEEKKKERERMFRVDAKTQKGNFRGYILV